MKLTMISRNIPRLLAEELVGVQPMAAPSGTIFSMKATMYYKPEEDFEKWICDITAILSEFWPEMFTNKKVFWPFVKVLRRLADNKIHPLEWGELEELAETINAHMAWVMKQHPDVAFDINMRGYPTEWHEQIDIEREL